MLANLRISASTLKKCCEYTPRVPKMSPILSSYHLSPSNIVPEYIGLVLQQALEGRLHDVHAVEGQRAAGRDAGAVGRAGILLGSTLFNFFSTSMTKI